MLTFNSLSESVLLPPELFSATAAATIGIGVDPKLSVLRLLGVRLKARSGGQCSIELPGIRIVKSLICLDGSPFSDFFCWNKNDSLN